MTQYTELLDKKAEELLLDDDNYEERLLEVATLFRDLMKHLHHLLKNMDIQVIYLIHLQR